jgi:hypothetical protein
VPSTELWKNEVRIARPRALNTRTEVLPAIAAKRKNWTGDEPVEKEAYYYSLAFVLKS